jgi:sRNA-binding carbon storage regulator CsrA
MEFRSRLEFSNDPRFINTVMLNRGHSDAHFEDRINKIIRHGAFVAHSNKLNGFGTLIDYSANINIMVGYFLNDVPVDSHTIFRTTQPYFYKESGNYKMLYCMAEQCDINVKNQSRQVSKKKVYLQIPLHLEAPQKLNIIKESIYQMAIQESQASSMSNSHYWDYNTDLH